MVVRKRSFIIIALLALVGCETEEVLPAKETTYTIQKGEHYSNPRFTALVKDQGIKFRATFFTNTAYHVDDSDNQINKLFGFSDCSGTHHKNSARFGWMFSNGKMFVYPYTYVDSKRIYNSRRPLAQVDLEKSYVYQIRISGNKYIFEIETPDGIQTESVDRGCSGSNELKYTLTPYFGGQLPAMHKMNLKVELL